MWSEGSGEFIEHKLVRRVFVLCICAFLINTNQGSNEADGAESLRLAEGGQLHASLLAMQDANPREWLLQRCLPELEERFLASTIVKAGKHILDRVIGTAAAADLVVPPKTPLLRALAQGSHDVCGSSGCTSGLAPSSSSPSPDLPCH